MFQEASLSATCHDKLFDLAVDASENFLDEHGQAIRQRVAKNSSRWLPSWIDARVTDAFLSKLRDTLAATSAPSHPWRTKYHAWLERFVSELASDPDLLEYCESIRAEALDNSVVGGYLAWLGRELQSKVQTDWAAEDGMFSSGLERAVLALGHWLDGEAGIRGPEYRGAGPFGDWALLLRGRRAVGYNDPRRQARTASGTGPAVHSGEWNSRGWIGRTGHLDSPSQSATPIGPDSAVCVHEPDGRDYATQRTDGGNRNAYSSAG
jgi:hypothetical protein